MSFRKCSKCELNYILDDQQPYCTVCMKELKGGLGHHDEEIDLCPICGEREPIAGQEYCSECLAEMKLVSKRTVKKDSEEEDDGDDEEEEPIEEEVIEEIADLPLDEEDVAVPPFELESINEELDDDEEPIDEEFDEDESEDEEEPDRKRSRRRDEDDDE